MKKEILTTATSFAVDKEFEDSRFCKVRIRAMHTGLNRNNINFSEECVSNAKETFKNIPILAYVTVTTDEDGNEILDYTAHERHIEEDAFNEGENRIIYDERVVGIIPETNNFELILDEETGNKYVYLDAMLYREYGNYCVDILESRGGNTDVSMEIDVLDSVFNAEKKYLDVKKMMASGLTLLGDDRTPGMYNAELQMFSLDKNNVNEQLIKIMQELKESLDNYTKFSQKGGNEVAEVEEKILNDEEGTSLEEETKVMEAEASEGEDVGNDDVDSSEDEANGEASESDEKQEDDEEKFSFKVVSENEEYSLTMSEKLYALCDLVNQTYANVDETFYCVDADDDNVYMTDYFNGVTYKQKYSEDGNNFALEGDRVQVFATWLTEDERAELDKIKEDYSAVSERLEKYEQEPEKMNILNSSEYSIVADKEEFASLMKQENHFDMSIEEVKKQADDITLRYAKSGKLNFAQKESNGIGSTPLPNRSENSGRYGDLFKE